MTESLKAVVEAQAAARARADTAAFASYMTAQATLALRDPELAGLGHRSFEVVDVIEDGGMGRSVVRYADPGEFVLRQAWERRDGGWVCIAAEATSISLPLVERAKRLFGRADKPPERTDLS